MGDGVGHGSVVTLYQHFRGGDRKLMSGRSACATQPDHVQKTKKGQVESGDGFGSGRPLKKRTSLDKNSRRNSSFPFYNNIVSMKVCLLAICPMSIFLSKQEEPSSRLHPKIPTISPYRADLRTKCHWRENFFCKVSHACQGSLFPLSAGLQEAYLIDKGAHKVNETNLKLRELICLVSVHHRLS